MELGIKDWMIIVGVLLLVAVLFDGLRRVINDRRNNIRMRAKPVYHENDVETSNHEIQGNARIVLRADGTPMPFNEQKVPVLLEPADDLKANKKSRRKKKEKAEPVEPVFKEDIPFTLDAFDDHAPAPVAKVTAPKEKEPVPAPSYEHFDEDHYDDEEQAADAALNEVLEQKSAAYSRSQGTRAESSFAQTTSAVSESTPQYKTQDKSQYTESKPKETPRQQEQDVVVMHVLAKDNAGFKGADLMQILLGCDMRYGRMNIFHRFEEGSTEDIQFSVANLVEPGTFDLDALHHFTTPGVSFFMTLPGPEKPLQAFDYMAATAQEIARHLDGEILDERKRILNDALISERRQSVQHYASSAMV